MAQVSNPVPLQITKVRCGDGFVYAASVILNNKLGIYRFLISLGTYYTAISQLAIDELSLAPDHSDIAIIHDGVLPGSRPTTRRAPLYHLDAITLLRADGYREGAKNQKAVLMDWLNIRGIDGILGIQWLTRYHLINLIGLHTKLPSLIVYQNW